jgi:hypothetical protein
MDDLMWCKLTDMVVSIKSFLDEKKKSYGREIDNPVNFLKEEMKRYELDKDCHVDITKDRCDIRVQVTYCGFSQH